MSEGILIINDAGTIQIDENLTNFELLATGTLTFGAKPVPPANGFTNEYPAPNWTHMLEVSHPAADSPILFWTCAVPVCLFGYYITGENLVFQVGASREFSDTNGVQFRYFVFGRPRQTVTETHGLIVRDAENRIVFNSNRRYLKLVDIRQVSDAGSLGGFSSKTYATTVLQNIEWASWTRRPGNLNTYNENFWALFTRPLGAGYDWYSARSHTRFTSQNVGEDQPKEIFSPGYGVVALADVTGF